MNGKLITFEGGEGSGKGVSIQKLAEQLRLEGYSISTYYEPGSTPVGELSRIIVKNKIDIGEFFHLEPMLKILSEEKVTNETIAFHFLAARSQLFKTRIIPDLEAGKIILLDRSGDSTNVYQGHVFGTPEFLKECYHMNKIAMHGIVPHRTILLDGCPKILLPRKKKYTESGIGTDRFDEGAIAIHDDVRNAYLEEAKLNPERYVIINSEQPIEKVHQKIYEKVLEIIKK